MEVDLGGLDLLVAEPERNHRGVDTGVEQSHRRAVTQHVQGDILLAEPNALIGFAGPRVIEQTIKEVLPEGFQHSEFLLEHGMIDRIVHRSEMKEILYRILSMAIEPKRKKAAS